MVDGVEFANVNFVVTTLGEPFLRDVTGEYTVLDFPDPGTNVTLRWSEAHQNFVFARTFVIPDNPNPPGHPRAFLESPSQGSAESGIGLIRGWVCEAERVEISIDGGALLLIAYGTTRADTRGVCGDDDNGFGFTVNWNTIGDGNHNLRVFADGVEFANVNFAVTTVRDGEAFLTDVSGEELLLPSASTRYGLRKSVIAATVAIFAPVTLVPTMVKF